MQVNVTEKQEEILVFIRDFYLEKGKAPSLTELQERFEIKSKRGVVNHLEALEKKGFIIRNGQPRGIHLQNEKNFDYLIGIPILGYANAGTPLALAQEEYIGNLQVDKNLLKGREDVFSVILKGNSMNKYKMNDVKLEDGNYAIVDKSSEIRNNDVVLALIGDCATVKIFKSFGEILALYPYSYDPQNQPIYLDKKREDDINGKVIMVLEKHLKN